MGSFTTQETYSDNVKIYEHRKLVQNFAQHSKKFSVNVYVLNYMIRLIERYRIKITKKRKYSYYSPTIFKRVRLFKPPCLAKEITQTTNIMKSLFNILKSEDMRRHFIHLSNENTQIVDYIDPSITKER